MTTTISYKASSKSAYPLRNKFLRQLIIKTGLDTDALDDAITIANEMDEATMLNTLWAMSFSFSREKALNQLHVTTDKLNELLEDNGMVLVPSEFVYSLRNELRHQYTLVHQGFLSTPDDEHAECFEQFVQSMGMDKILSTVIYTKVSRFLAKYLSPSSTSIISKTIYLLKSDLGNFRYGGLKNIGFISLEAKELLDRTGAIADLLENLYEASFPKGISSKSVLNEKWNRPFEDLDKMLEESGFTFSTGKTIEIPVQPEEGDDSAENVSIEPVEHASLAVSRVTSIDVLQNPDLFKQFIRGYDDISQAGFDINEVIEKLDAIRNLLHSYDALS